MRKKQDKPLKQNLPKNERVFLPDIEVNPAYGLSADQVRERERKGFVNTPVDPDTRTVGQIIRSNTFTYFNMIFVILAGLLVMVRSYRDMLFMGVIISNTLIGIIQEIRSKKALDDLKIISASRIITIRDGKEQEVLTEKLVLDDIVRLKAGAQIPADAVVVSGSIRVNEALLTGEADEIEKQEGGRLLSGSFVAAGSCLAKLTAVGEDSYISKLTIEATTRKSGEQSEMIRALNRLVKIVGVIIIPIGGLLFYQQYFVVHNTFRDSITGMVAAVIGMIPEGLYLTASIALAVSAMRLASKKVLIHDMKSIETLARVTVLCVDKTGTITEDHMEVKGLIADNRSPGIPEKMPEVVEAVLDKGTRQLQAVVKAEGIEDIMADPELAEVTAAAAAAPEIEAADTQGDASGDAEVRALLADFAAAMPAENATMRALQEYFTEGTGKKPEKVVPFSSRVKYSGCVMDGVSYVLGAPEYLLGDEYDLYKESLESHGESGYRVLAFGTYDGELDGEMLNMPVRLLATVLLANRVRASAPETFRYFAERDAQVKVISGDNPVSVSAIAAEAGIAGAEEYVDAGTLKSDEEIAAALQKYTVFGRVTPEQKRRFVKALKGMGETVAMTGDGVNDVLALKDADCSIAMASGAEAASQVAQLVLLDSDFSKMPDIVLEGRRVVNNIERTASLFLVKNIFSLLLSVFSVILVMDYPLEAAQVSLIGMFTIGIPAFLLSQEPNKDPIRGRFLTNVFLRALPAGLTDFVMVLALTLFAVEFNIDNNSLSTACTLLVAMVGFMIMYRIMKPMTKLHWAIWLSMLAGMVFCLFNLTWFFSITAVTRQIAMLMIVFGIAAEPMMRYLGIFTEWLLKKITPTDT